MLWFRRSEQKSQVPTQQISGLDSLVSNPGIALSKHVEKKPSAFVAGLEFPSDQAGSYRGISIRGFTLVELISVLVLVAVVGGVLVGRLIDTDSYNEVLARDQLLSIARMAQQLGFSRSSVELYFLDTGSEVKVVARVGGIEQTSRTFPKSEVTIMVDGTSTSGSPGVCSDLSSPVTLQFDSNAELSGAYPSGNYNQGFPICFNGNTPNLCISPAGFAHLGSCV